MFFSVEEKVIFICPETSFQTKFPARIQLKEEEDTYAEILECYEVQHTHIPLLNQFHPTRIIRGDTNKQKQQQQQQQQHQQQKH